MFRKILPHLLIVLSIVMLVFLVIDQVNAAMAFINNQGTKIIMMVYSVLVLVLAILYTAEHRR